MSTLENIGLTGKIKAAMLIDDRIGATGIDVDTVGQGEVHLKGRVATDVESRLAEDIARLNGAHSVVNELAFDRVVEVTEEDSPAASGAYGRVTTSAGAPETGLPLQMQIEDALSADPRVNAHLLRVNLLEGGNVSLGGRQGTVQQRDAALEVARSISGVSGVLDEIEIQPAY